MSEYAQKNEKLIASLYYKYKKTSDDDIRSDKIKAILFDEDSQTLDGTDGEHFLMVATLMIQKP